MFPPKPSHLWISKVDCAENLLECCRLNYIMAAALLENCTLACCFRLQGLEFREKVFVSTGFFLGSVLNQTTFVMWRKQILTWRLVGSYWLLMEKKCEEHSIFFLKLFFFFFFLQSLFRPSWITSWNFTSATKTWTQNLPVLSIINVLWKSKGKTYTIMHNCKNIIY